MNTKQIKINKDKIVRLLLALALVFTVSMPVNAAPTELHPEGNPEKQTTFQIQTNCIEGQALSYTTEQGLVCKNEVFGTTTATEQSEVSERAQDFLNIINSGDTNAQLAFEIDFCGNNKYLVGFTIEGDVRCLDKTEPQILNSYCGEGEVAVGFEEVTEKEVYHLNIIKTESLSTLSEERLAITDLKTGEKVISLWGRNTHIPDLVDINDNYLSPGGFLVGSPAINTTTPFIQIADSSSTQTAEDISKALPAYWKYSSIYNYDVSVSGSIISISKKDGSSIANLAITALGSEFGEVTRELTTEDVEGEYQLGNYKPKCLDLEELLISIPTTERRTDLLDNVSAILSCGEGQVVSSLPKENSLIIVGAPGDDDGGSNRGAVYIFEQQEEYSWFQAAKISNDGSVSENIDLDNSDAFGKSVSYYDGLIAVSAPGDDDGGDDIGAVYLFEKDSNGNWTKTLKISDNTGSTEELAVNFNWTYTDRSPSFGASVSAEKDLLFVGVPGEQGSGTNQEGKNNGAVYIFEKSNLGEWFLSHKILDDTSDVNATHINLTTDSFFGKSVFYSEGLLFVGANIENGVNDIGAVHVFEKGSTTNDWTKKTRITTNVAGVTENFGHSLSYKNGELLVGNTEDGTSTSTGAVYSFNKENDGTWTPNKRISYDAVPDTVFDLAAVTQDFDNFTGGVFRPGWGVSNSNSLILLGSATAVNTSVKGGVIIYRKQSNGSLTKEYTITDSESTESTLRIRLDSGDEFGSSVALNRYPVAGEWTCIDEPKSVVASIEYETKTCELLLNSFSDTGVLAFAGNLKGTTTKKHNLFLPYQADIYYEGELHTNGPNGELSSKADINIRKTNETTSSPLLENQTLDRGIYVIEVSGKNNSYIDGYTLKVTPTFYTDSHSIPENCVDLAAGEKQPIIDSSFYVSIFSKDLFETQDDKKIRILSSKDATFEIKSPCGSPTGANLNDETDKDIELVKANGDPLDTYTKYNCNIEVTSDDGDVVVKTIPEFSIYALLDLNNYDEFAADIATSDSYTAFGASGNGTSDRGAVYLFEKPDNSGEEWKKRIEFSDNNGGYGKVAVSLGTGDSFGGAVSLDDDTLIVGAEFDDDGGGNRGAVYIFEKSSGVWSQTLKISDNGGDGSNGKLDIDLENSDRFGSSVAYSNLGILVVGALGDDDGGSERGAAYIFSRNSSGVWSQNIKISDNDGASGKSNIDLSDWDFFGSSVAIYADTSERVIAVGAPNSTNTDTGAVYIFERQTNGNWDHINTISESAAGTKDTQIDLGNYDFFGSSVGLYKDTLVVGSPKDDDGGNAFGAVYVFEKENTLVTPEVCTTSYYCSNTSYSSFCGGYSVRGTTCYPRLTRDGVCSNLPALTSTTCTPAVYEDKWVLKNKISDNAGDAGKIDVSFLGLGGESYFGNSLEIYDDLLIIGEQDKGGEALFEGAAHIFKISGGEFNYSETISNGYPNN